MRFMTGFRLFFIGAMMTAGIVDLYASNFFSTPLEQLTVSTLSGAAAVLVGKISGAFV